MPLATINQTSIAYDVSGAGDPVVVIHGSWTERRTWQRMAAVLSASFEVVIYDRRGHGDSAAPPDQGDVHDDVADAAALIEALGLAPAHVVANSYGSCVALRLVAAHPHLVRRLVAHEPPALRVLDGGGGDAGAGGGEDPAVVLAGEVREQLAEVRRLLEAGDHSGGARHFVENVALGPGAWDQLPPEVRESFVRHAPTFLAELRDPDALGVDAEGLRRTPVPVLLSAGERSPAFFAPVIERLVALVPGARSVLLAGAGHVPHLSHAGDYGAVVTSFLNGG